MFDQVTLTTLCADFDSKYLQRSSLKKEINLAVEPLCMYLSKAIFAIISVT